MPLTPKIIKKILSDYGFIFDRQQGSHQQYKKWSFVVTVPDHKEFRPWTALSMLKSIAKSREGEVYSDIIKKYSIKL